MGVAVPVHQAADGLSTNHPFMATRPSGLNDKIHQGALRLSSRQHVDKKSRQSLGSRSARPEAKTSAIVSVMDRAAIASSFVA